jgi:proline dehydrogenase
MTILSNPLRPAILAAARSPRLQRTITKAPVTKKIVERFIAGEDRPAVLAVAQELLGSGAAVSIDFLGEQTTDRGQADAIVAEYLALVDELAALTPVGTKANVHPTEVSMKLSALGQALPTDGDKIATENAWKICSAAAERGVWVSVDAEDHTTTDSTLAIVTSLRAEFPWLGAVLQAYLHRTEEDCRAMAGSGSRIRLCKGAYQEPAEVAFQRKSDVTDSYLRCLEILMAGDGYPMAASHDPAVISATSELATRNGRRANTFEHQMLYGIRDLEQKRLVEAGSTMRVYIPYGSQWYAYFMRRLAERPSNLTFFLRSIATRG